MIMPLFFVGAPNESTGLISIYTEAEEFDLDLGILSKNMPGMLVAFLSQSLPSFRNLTSLCLLSYSIRYLIGLLTYSLIYVNLQF